MSKVSQQKDNIRQSTTHGCLAGFIKHYTSFHDKIQEKHNERQFCQANLGSDFLGKADMKSAQSKKFAVIRNITTACDLKALLETSQPCQIKKQKRQLCVLD